MFLSLYIYVIYIYDLHAAQVTRPAVRTCYNPEHNQLENMDYEKSIKSIWSFLLKVWQQPSEVSDVRVSLNAPTEREFLKQTQIFS